MADIKKIRSKEPRHTNSAFVARIPKIMKYNTYQPIDRQDASEEGWEEDND